MYLIDGHNLIGTGLLGFSLDDPDDEMKLVELLRRFAAGNSTRVTVCFDGGLPGGISRASNSVVKVIFASDPTIADKLIMRELRATKDTSRWTVVSNDAEVRKEANLRKFKTAKSHDFAKLLMQQARGKTFPYPTNMLKKPGRDDDDPGSAATPRQTQQDLDYFAKAFKSEPRTGKPPRPR
ncbi:MAG: YacP-like NYN domain protein [Chloroflexi bacterium OLB15]|nr:MAG: YacP-like NYN domain protein [Chloroflexi bacterium OLB15]